MTNRSKIALAVAIACSTGLTACGDLPNNRSLYSVNQPVVEHRNFTFDLNAPGGTVPISEQRRLADWFETMHLRYGDRIAVDGGMANSRARDDVAGIAGRYGMLLSDGAPVTEGFVQPGIVRVVITRARASVPGCPDWSDHYITTLENATSDGYGCAVNGNYASMVADPEHLLHGAQGTGETVVMSSSKAIETYRAAIPTGKAGLPAISTQSGK
ncbi:MAG: CpaD family pilus assembly protein [Croceibacterium sp.]